jgi:hypothetical protein
MVGSLVMVAQFSPNSESIALLIPILGVMIPIIVVLLKHQQTMALIHRGIIPDDVRSKNPNAFKAENFQAQQQMLDEMRQLRQIVTDQSLAIESLRSQVSDTEGLRERLKN